MSYRVNLEIKDGFYITGLPEDVRKKIEEELTFDNPKYLQIKKYSRYSSTREPKYLEYFQYFEKEGQLVMRVPIGYNIFKYLRGFSVYYSDGRKKRLQKDFPEFKLELRGTQEEALKSFMKFNQDLTCTGLIELPTGKGKTILGLSIAATLKSKTLIIVHKTDLVHGWLDEISRAFDDEADVGVIKAQQRKVGNHFTIATIQTLNRLSPDELSALYSTFGFIIQDECHHCPASSFSLSDNFIARYRLGLSATPERSDGLTHVMKLYYGSFCYRYVIDPTTERDILPVKVITRPVKLEFNPVCTLKNGVFTYKGDLNVSKNFNPDYNLQSWEERIRNIDYAKRPQIAYSDIDFAVTNHPVVVDQILTDILFEYQRGHSCIVFFKQVNTLLNYEQHLLDRGIPESEIGLYYGGNLNCEQVKTTAENNRRYITLATYSKATEGTNVKQWEVCFLVSSVNDGKNIEQAIGRIRRTKSDGEKISPVLVYDYAYNSCYPLYGHHGTRMTRYKKLKCITDNFNSEKDKMIVKKKRTMFTRGYNK